MWQGISLKSERNNPWFNQSINCVCYSKRSMFRVLGMYNFGRRISLWGRHSFGKLFSLELCWFSLAPNDCYHYLAILAGSAKIILSCLVQFIFLFSSENICTFGGATYLRSISETYFWVPPLKINRMKPNLSCKQKFEDVCQLLSS